MRVKMAFTEAFASDATPEVDPMDLSRDQLLGAYRTMRSIRTFEQTLNELSQAGRVPGFLHLYAGEEAVAVGVCLSLGEQDWVASTHRGHGHAIAKGVELSAMMAEIFGQAQSGVCKGKGGSMHIADTGRGTCSVQTGSSAAGFRWRPAPR